MKTRLGTIRGGRFVWTLLLSCACSPARPDFENDDSTPGARDSVGLDGAGGTNGAGGGNGVVPIAGGDAFADSVTQGNAATTNTMAGSTGGGGTGLAGTASDVGGADTEAGAEDTANGAFPTDTSTAPGSDVSGGMMTDTGGNASEETNTAAEGDTGSNDMAMSGSDLGGTEVNTTEPDTDTDEAATVSALGASCSRSADCASNFCVDGVCCETACSDVCNECNASGSAGKCTAPAADDACPDVDCPTGNECRAYELPAGDSCTGLGQCVTASACVTVDRASNTACQSGLGSCNGSGECVVPDKAKLGEGCSGDDECGSGNCAKTADGKSVCCDQACDGVCTACSSSGFCDDAPADDDRCATVSCSADSTCADYPPTLTTDRCVDFGKCVTASNYCQPKFASSSTSCGTAMLCNGAGACEDACSSNEDWCTDTCADLDTDDDNCGSCGNKCPSGTSCEDGDCECTSAGKLLCSDECIDPMADADNCGSCGGSCPTPSEAGSTRACLEGSCGGCGAYGQACCETGVATPCASGLSCSSGQCQCGTSSHLCSTGAFAGKCRENVDPRACGSSCNDCEQANAVAVCASGQCANECPAGVHEFCPRDSDGFVHCGLWEFESDTLESWVINDSSAAYKGAMTIEPDPSDSSNLVLAIPFDSETKGATGSSVLLEVPVCSFKTVSLVGHTISMRVRFDGPAKDKTGSTASGGVTFTLRSGGQTVGSINPIGGLPINSWTDVGPHGIDSGWAHSPSTPTDVSHVGFTLGVIEWAGKIYVDYVLVE